MKEIMMFKFHSSNIYFIASEKCISNDPNLLKGGWGGGTSTRFGVIGNPIDVDDM